MILSERHSARRSIGLVVSLAAWGVAVHGQEPAPSTDPFVVELEPPVEPARDAGRHGSDATDHARGPDLPSRSRSLERLHWVCETDLNRKDVTLFANGTLRLRKVENGELTMWLEELPLSELDAYIERLRQPTRVETPPEFEGPSGDWLGQCRLRLHLPGREVEEYRFGARQALTLDLERTVAVARELEQRFLDRDAVPEGQERLASNYQPVLGDVLQHRDGSRFQVFGFTADGLGIELLGLADNPLTLYLSRDELMQQFTVLLTRRDSAQP